MTTSVNGAKWTMLDKFWLNRKVLRYQLAWFQFNVGCIHT